MGIGGEDIKDMDWETNQREEIAAGIWKFYHDKIETDPKSAIVMIEQELHDQYIRLGNDWTGRGVVVNTLIDATISALEAVRVTCLEKIEHDKG